MIAEAKIKSDKIDADILSDLLRSNFLPTSYIPDQKTRSLREVLRHRMRLVSMRARLKNRLRDVLTKNNQHEQFTDITGIKAQAFLRALTLPPEFTLQRDDILSHIQFINTQIDSTNKILKTYAGSLPHTERLTSIEGIGIFSALVILAEIGDIHRFASPKKLVRYAGLCPGLHQNGNTCYSRPIPHDGNHYLRWIFTEVAHHAVRHPGPLKEFYTQLSRTKGSQKAIVAVARKILTGVFFVLKNDVPFNPVRRKRYSANLDKPAGETWPKKAEGTIG
jgi:transposase